AEKSHEEVAHAAGCTADIGHLRQHDAEFIHDLSFECACVRQIKNLLEPGLCQFEPLPHCSFHRSAVLYIERMKLGHGLNQIEDGRDDHSLDLQIARWPRLGAVFDEALSMPGAAAGRASDSRISRVGSKENRREALDGLQYSQGYRRLPRRIGPF